MDWAKKMVPHACLFIDTTLQKTYEGLEIMAYSSEGPRKRHLAEEDVDRLWRDTSDNTSVLTCLSVRSGLDLYLSVMQYPPGSEIIMSALNIPTMVAIVLHHNLVIKSCDVSIHSLAPSMAQLEALITDKTVAVLVAHVYGKRFNMQPVVDLCMPRNIAILEDCAESFGGFSYRGHPDADVAFFSFGTIKVSTVFGGAILAIKDKDLYQRMYQHHESYPIQTQLEYARKLTKCAFITTVLNSPFIVRWGTGACRLVGVDHKDIVVPMLRGFPVALIKNVRRRPSLGLMNNLVLRLTYFDEHGYKLSKQKGDYVVDRLPEEAIAVGQFADVIGYWLFPILVEKPSEVVKYLSDMGVDATRGKATQLQEVFDSPSEKDICSPMDQRYGPTHVRFLVDHLVYLPINKLIPYAELDKVIAALKEALSKLECKRPSVPKFS